MRINYDFTDLEAFLAVMDTRSFHLAADRVNSSQPSISRRIQKLETALQSRLFERSTREVRPTLAAKRLQQRAEALLEEARETTRALRDESAAFAHQMAQSVTIAAIPTAVSGLIAPAIRRVLSFDPGLRVRILDRSANEVADAVAAGDADFGVSSIALTHPTTEFEPLYSDPIGLALPDDDPLAQSGSKLRWQDFSDRALILPARGTGNRLVIDDALARADLRLRWTIEVSRTTTALDLVASGIGVAPLPSAGMLGVGGRLLAWREVHAPAVSRPVGLVRRLGQKDSAFAARLITEIRDLAAAVRST